MSSAENAENHDSPFLDRSQPIVINEHGKLPHWNQNGKLQFVTLRLADSLPSHCLESLVDQRRKFFARFTPPWNKEQIQRYNTLLGKSFEKFLSAGYGSCLLRNPEIRQIVVNAIHFRDGEDYLIEAYVIMPNHLHLLIQVFEHKSLSEILGSIRRFSATSIQKVYPTGKALWAKEFYDRILRNEAHYRNCVRYIVDNPRFLRSEDFSLFVRGKV